MSERSEPSPRPFSRDGATQLAPLGDRPANLFVVGMDEYQHEHLRALDPGGAFRFRTLVPMTALRGVDALPVGRLLQDADEQLQRFPEPVDGILSFLDFPAVEMAALLATRWKLSSPTLSAVLRCNHKYWCRKLQEEVVPEATPRFTTIDPFEPDLDGSLEERLPYPFWIKPLNAYRSHLGFRIDSADDLSRALPTIRAGIRRLADPLEELMNRADVPEEIRRLGGHRLVAEEMVGGRECTLEGYVRNGTPRIYGVVDSTQQPGRASFSRYEYPSSLPSEVTDRMVEAAGRMMRHVGFDDGAFNIEFFHDEERDRVWLLEVNPRTSQSHAELFQRVDGASNQKVAVDLALGREPSLPHRDGEYACAGKFFLRAWGNARVVRVPSREEVRGIQDEVPGSLVVLQVEEGRELAELHDQDSYSYELAWIWVGARTRQELVEKYERIENLLRIELERAEDAPNQDR